MMIYSHIYRTHGMWVVYRRDVVFDVTFCDLCICYIYPPIWRIDPPFAFLRFNPHRHFFGEFKIRISHIFRKKSAKSVA